MLQLQLSDIANVNNLKKNKIKICLMHLHVIGILTYVNIILIYVF